MNNGSYTQPVGEQNNTAAPKRVYSVTESVFAWLCLFFGYLVFRVFPFFDSPLGTAVTAIALYAVTLCVLLIRKIRPDGFLPVLVLISSVAFSSACFISGTEVFRFLCAMYAAVMYPFFLMSWTGNRIEKGFSDLLFPELMRALFICPFYSFGAVFSACKGGKKGGVIGKVIGGLLIAVIPTSIVASLLSYDEGFRRIMKSIFRFSADDIVSQIFSIFFGILLGMYLFGAYLSAADKAPKPALTAEGYRGRAMRMRVLPALTAVVSTLPLMFVYVVFFISQWDYYVSAFGGKLPAGTIYSNYAREGFFQLCGVAALNFFVIALLLTFIRRKENGRPHAAVTAAAMLLSLSTLVLIATAVSKMVLYIKAYGLTGLRVFTTWFMAFLTVCTLVVIAGLFSKKIKTLPLCAAVLVVMSAALVFANIDRIIADYNTDRYLDGSLGSVDTDMLVSLGDDAVPAMLRLLEHWDSEEGTDSIRILRESESVYETVKNVHNAGQKSALSSLALRIRAGKPGFFERDLSYYIAEKALKDAGLRN